MLAAGPALATLTATVSPGYQFSANERPTTATLNLLATPTITIFGTVDGSTGLTPGSVTGTMLADSVSDTEAGSTQATLDWYSYGGGRALQIANGGVSWMQINTNSLGRGLSGGYSVGGMTGTNLNVNYDGTTITLNTNNELKISDSFLAGIFFSYPATAGFTNSWGLANAFAITNTTMPFYTNGVSTGTNISTAALANTDVLPIKSAAQRTNTTATLGAIADFALTTGRDASVSNLTASGTLSFVRSGYTNHVMSTGGKYTNLFSSPLGTTNYVVIYSISGNGTFTTTKLTNGFYLTAGAMATATNTVDWLAIKPN
jgi:hypothetical protein